VLVLAGGTARVAVVSVVVVSVVVSVVVVVVSGAVVVVALPAVPAIATAMPAVAATLATSEARLAFFAGCLRFIATSSGVPASSPCREAAASLPARCEIAGNVRTPAGQRDCTAIRADRARELLPVVQDTGWFFDTELLVLAERCGRRIHDVSVDPGRRRPWRRRR
jgi:hypothetical protein